MLILVGCTKNSHIPNSSIIEEIQTNKLSDILDYEKKHPVYGYSFEEMYPEIRNSVSEMDEIEKAKYAKLTYREVFNTQCAVDDTIKRAKYREQWNAIYEELLPKAKSKASELEHDIITGSRAYAFDNNRYDFSSFKDFLRINGYNKFLKAYVVGPQYIDDDSWNYDAIITKYIDTDFRPCDEWITFKILDENQSKYPLGTQFVREQYEKTYQRIIDLFDYM